jgi:hypothetical protein
MTSPDEHSIIVLVHKGGANFGANSSKVTSIILVVI